MNLRKKDLKYRIENKSIKSERKEKQLWTNCEGFLVNFLKKWNRVRYFMKKTFIVWLNLEQVEKDYLIIKKYFKNLIPNTVFIEGKDKEIFSFSEPVVIDFDILEEKNKDFFYKILENWNKKIKILKQLKFFIRKFRLLEKQWNVLDLYWKENLVFTKDGKVKYIDNYEIFWKNNTVIDWSIEKIKYLENLLNILENNKK